MTDQDSWQATAMVICGRIRPGDVRGLCRRLLRTLPALGAGDVVCDVGGVVEADAVTVDALARLQLTARRRGRRVRLRNASGPLRELLDLVGLGEVVPLCRDSGVQPGWQAEAREDGRGVEERVEADDLAP
ncbi:MAG TPA: STAS domain-containing protein [Candidatus Dormibacteraeota bacterium]